VNAKPPPIYLDNHATTRTDPRVLDVMLPFFTQRFGNAASINHSFGWEASDAVESAREQIAGLLNTSAKGLIFTSGATESNNIVIKGLAATKPNGHIITNAAEHRSVLDPVKRIQRSGCEITILPVDRFGMVCPESIANAIRPETILVSVMLANNEVGTINPITEIGEICRSRGVLLHCDIVQAVGKLPVDLSKMPVDLASLTAHKLYGPKGVGALYIRRGAPRISLQPLFDGGGHENHLRSGTLPVPLIVGFGKCCEIAQAEMESESLRTTKLRNRLWDELSRRLDGITMNGHATERLPNNLNVSFASVDGEALMTSLKTIAVSSGSACTSADPEPSHVLRHMGVSDELTRASLRFGIGRFNTDDEIDTAVNAVADAVETLRNTSA